MNFYKIRMESQYTRKQMKDYATNLAREFNLSSSYTSTLGRLASSCSMTDVGRRALENRARDFREEQKYFKETPRPVKHIKFGREAKLERGCIKRLGSSSPGFLRNNSH
jgi:hypothetical protein